MSSNTRILYLYLSLSISPVSFFFHPSPFFYFFAHPITLSHSLYIYISLSLYLSLSVEHHSEVLQRQLKEAEIQKAMKSPYIIPLWNTIHKEGYLYLIMEYAPFGTLRSAISVSSFYSSSFFFFFLFFFSLLYCMTILVL